MLLDEVAFKNQCLDLGVDHHPFDVPNLGHQTSNSQSVIGRLLEVATDSIAKVYRLSNVEYLVLLTFIKVAAGLGRQESQLLSNCFGKVAFFSRHDKVGILQQSIVALDLNFFHQTIDFRLLVLVYTETLVNGSRSNCRCRRPPK